MGSYSKSSTTISAIESGHSWYKDKLVYWPAIYVNVIVYKVGEID